MPSRRSAYPAVGREPRADQLLQHHGVSAGHALRQNFQQPMHCTEQHSNALSGNSAQHQPADQLHSVGKPVEVGSKLCTLCCERIQVCTIIRNLDATCLLHLDRPTLALKREFLFYRWLLLPGATTKTYVQTACCAWSCCTRNCSVHCAMVT